MRRSWDGLGFGEESAVSQKVAKKSSFYKSWLVASGGGILLRPFSWAWHVSNNSDPQLTMLLLLCPQESWQPLGLQRGQGAISLCSPGHPPPALLIYSQFSGAAHRVGKGGQLLREFFPHHKLCIVI